MKKLLLLLLLLCQPLRALDVIQNVDRAFIIESPFVDSVDATVETGLTPSSFTVNVYRKNRKALALTIAACVWAPAIKTSMAGILFTTTYSATLNSAFRRSP